MVHLNKYRQGTRSTKENIDELMVEDDDEDEIELEPPRQIVDRKHCVGIECIPFEELHEKLKKHYFNGQNGTVSDYVSKRKHVHHGNVRLRYERNQCNCDQIIQET